MTNQLLTIKRSRSKGTESDRKRRESPHGSMFHFTSAPANRDTNKGNSVQWVTSLISPTNIESVDSPEDTEDLLFDFKSLLEISDEELKLELQNTESWGEREEITHILEQKSESDDSNNKAIQPEESEGVDDKQICEIGGPSLSDPVLTLTFPSADFSKDRATSEHWEVRDREVSYHDEGADKPTNEDKNEALAGTTPIEKDSPRRKLIMSDMISLNNMPSVQNPDKMTRELELADMWEIIGSALVKHQGVRSLLLELAAPMHSKDLPLLERWAQTKLNSPEVSASFASQAQIFELNTLKRQTSRKRLRRKPRIRHRVLRNVPDWNGGDRLKLKVQKMVRGHSDSRQTRLQLPNNRSRHEKQRKHSAHRERNRTNAERIMPIKCLFIDIEGVITPLEGPRLPRHYRETTRSIAKKLLVLKLVVHLTRCKLVLTGAARSYPKFVIFVNSFFKSWGINPFYSATQSFHSENHLVRLLPENKRAQEVEQWIASRNVKSWCVVDTMDLSILEKDGIERTVMVNGKIGLTKENGEAILNILGVELDLYR